jgi:hypothetical protein
MASPAHQSQLGALPYGLAERSTYRTPAVTG